MDWKTRLKIIVIASVLSLAATALVITLTVVLAHHIWPLPTP